MNEAKTSSPVIRPLLLADQPFITGFLSLFPREISEFTFTNLFVWQHSRPIYFSTIDSSLFFLTHDKDEQEKYLLFGPPLGNISLQAILNILKDGLAGGIRLDRDSIRSRESTGQEIMEDRDNADYVYRVADLATLAGRKYAKKRNQIKQCLQNHHCEYEIITEENIPECLAMQESWCRIRNCDHAPGLCSENIAIEEIFKHYRELNLLGGAIRVDGTIGAYTIGEQLHPGTAVCHFEKAIPSIQGMGQLINHWFAKYALHDFEFINREQDLGIPGLRQAKESYSPHHLVHKYTVRLSQTASLMPASTKQCADY